MTKNSASHKDMRSITLMKVIKTIREGAKSKNEIREKTGLSWGSCSETISLLTKNKMLTPIQMDDKKGSKGGRRTTSYKFANDVNLLIGMEIKANSIICSLANLGTEELNSKKYELTEKFRRINIFNIILSVFNKFLNECGLKEENILGLSISLTGAVDLTSNRLIYSPRYKDIVDIDFDQFRHLVPSVRYFTVEHDINAQASSTILNNGWTEKNYAFLHFGEGVGMTIYNEGLYTGAKGFAGEIGHLPHRLEKINKTCTCGRKNCYETILSTSGIFDLIKEKFGSKAANFEKLEPSVLTNPLLLEMISKAISDIIIMVSNILNPGAVYLGGEAIEPFIGPIRSRIEEKVKNEAWLGGPGVIKWFSSKDINCAYGTIMNSNNIVIEQYIADNLI